jgi:hypothetical protein
LHVLCPASDSLIVFFSRKAAAHSFAAVLVKAVVPQHFLSLP